MPSWEVHAEIARLIGVEPRRDLDRLIDSLESHDIGRRLPRRINRRHIEKLEILSGHPGYFYLHHAADLLRDMVAYYLLAGEPPEPPVLLRAQIEAQLLAIRFNLHDRLDHAGYRGPAFHRLAEGNVIELPEVKAFLDNVEEAVALVKREALEAASKIVDLRPWEEIFMWCLEKARSSAKSYEKGSRRIFHPSFAALSAERFYTSRLFNCLADKAAIKTRLAPLLVSAGHVFMYSDGRGVFYTVHDVLANMLQYKVDARRALQEAFQKATALYIVYSRLDEQTMDLVRARLWKAVKAAEQAAELLGESRRLLGGQE